MKKVSLFVFVIVFFFFQTFAQEVDKEKSNVTFSVRNMKIRSVDGMFTGLQGIILLNTPNKENAQIQVCLDAQSINTANEKRDAHLRNEDFFAVDRFPSICFTSTNVQFLSENQVLAKGKLTLHGISRDIEIPLTKIENTWISSFQVNRLDYEIGQKYGSFMIGEIISIEVKCLVK